MDDIQRFGLVGAAGYIAPRHMKAIRDTGNLLVAAVDPHDSVGALDSYFPEVAYFREFERFDRHLEKIRKEGSGIDYLSICSPNYLHDAHVRAAMRLNADAICEKPLVLNPWNCDALEELEEEFGRKVYTVLQLRTHPSVRKLYDMYWNDGRHHEIDLIYVTPRGPWYQYSWKGDEEKSGGLATNIGIHFFDMLLWIFGSVRSVRVRTASERWISGELELENASVRWNLSIAREHLPSGWDKPAFRSIEIDGEEVEFSDGFKDLHTTVYSNIMSGSGYGIGDARSAIRLVYEIREQAKSIVS